MIQALRNMIVLFTHFFDALEYMLDRFLDLLALCICQENDTIARIGSNCLQQLILQNVLKFNAGHWNQIVGSFCELFERTTAYQLFSATTINAPSALSPPPNGLGFEVPLTPTDDTEEGNALSINGTDKNGQPSESETKSGSPASAATDDESLRTPTMSAATPLEEFKPSSSLQQQPVVVTAARRRFFNRIISRCVLQLLMIETVNELFSNEAVYSQIPSAELLRLMALLKKSFLFARKFNNDKELRMRLWREGGSAATYIQILFRMFADTSPSRAESRPEVEKALIPLCKDVIKGYLALEEESQQRNIVAWRPVVVDVLEGYSVWPEKEFEEHLRAFYPLVVELLGKEVSPDLRGALLMVLRRIGEVALRIEGMTGGRRDSVISVAATETPGGELGHGGEEGEVGMRMRG
ncbi:hypothetical protein PG997_008908 [Apiospora hydei]|uniref:Sec7/BIG1-like C-terminal domain-containing protein n=1 Tax=Apiospora hydei TaxID=1337664 RepID=A0ABR1WC65_9PEZI